VRIPNRTIISSQKTPIHKKTEVLLARRLSLGKASKVKQQKLRQGGAKAGQDLLIMLNLLTEI
jgi:hypothetical protein